MPLQDDEGLLPDAQNPELALVDRNEHAGSWSDVCCGRASQELGRDSCTLRVLHCTDDSQQTVEKGQTLRSRSSPTAQSVRC